MTTENFILPDWPAPATIKAYTSLKESGIGNDDGKNSSRLNELLALPNEPYWLKQIHGADVIPASNALNSQHPEADASYSDQPDTVCVVRTADCLPVFITNRQGTQVAAIHAGWRGLAADILPITLQKMGIVPAETLVWLGPGISGERFEVRKDVYDIFTGKNAANETAFKKISDEQWLLDLYAIARMQLQKQGVTQIFGGEYCTYSDPERFFSYRRDGKLTGRIISLIWIADSTNKKNHV
jgi:YfiH family protein